MIVSFDKIRSVINSIADKYDVKRVSVFGSYAKGTQNENSDVDLVHGPLKEDSIIVIEKKVNIYEN